MRPHEKNHLAVFQHTPDEPMGYFEDLLREWHIPYTIYRLFETNEIPLIRATHLLVLGGPMSVNDEEEYPCLAEEKTEIRSWVKSGSPVVGICLGAQLIAAAFGGKVYPGREENGWTEIHSSGCGIVRNFPFRFRAFQMHGETFEIPSGGKILCTGDDVHNQAFQIGSANGFQFHPEITVDLIRKWTGNLPPFTRARISHDTEDFLSSSQSLCRTLAKRFFYPHGIAKKPTKNLSAEGTSVPRMHRRFEET